MSGHRELAFAGYPHALIRQLTRLGIWYAVRLDADVVVVYIHARDHTDVVRICEKLTPEETKLSNERLTELAAAARIAAETACSEAEIRLEEAVLARRRLRNAADHACSWLSLAIERYEQAGLDASELRALHLWYDAV